MRISPLQPNPYCYRNQKLLSYNASAKQPTRSRAYGHVATWLSTISTQKDSVLPPGMPLFGIHFANTLVCTSFFRRPYCLELVFQVPVTVYPLPKFAPRYRLLGCNAARTRHFTPKKTFLSITSEINTAGHKTSATRGFPRWMPLVGI